MNPALTVSPARAPDGLIATLRSYPRSVWILFAGVFLNKFGTFVVPFLTVYLIRRGFTKGEAGIALGAYGLGRVFAALLGGHLADAIGRRNTIIVSTTLSAVSMLLLSQASSLAAIALMTGLASLTGEMYVPACAAMLADLVPAHRRVTLFSTYRMAFNAGWALGPATAAFLAANSFTWLFVGDAVTSLLFAAIAWRGLPRGTDPIPEARWSDALRAQAKDHRFLRVLAATTLIGLALHQIVSTFGLHVAALGFKPTLYGSLLSFNGMLVLLCELPVTRLTGRHPPRPVIALGYLLMGLGLASNAVAHSGLTLFLGMAVLTLGEMTFAPVISAFVAGLAPPSMRGRYMGSWAMANSVSMALAPSLGMLLLGFSPTVLWMSCGLVAMFAAMIILGDAPVSRRLTFLPRNTLHLGNSAES